MSNLPAQSQIVPATRYVGRTASATPFEESRGFHANVTESITVQFADRATTDTLSVVSGVCYPYAIKVYSSGTQTLGTLY